MGQNDFPATDEQMQRRFDFLSACLKRFVEGKRPDALYNTMAVDRINRTYWAIVRGYVKPKMANSKRIDLHKIIAGTQYAVMSTLVVRRRVAKEAEVSSPEEARKNPAICKLNAEFALYVALVMFEQYTGLSVKPLVHRKTFMEEHFKWLLNLQKMGIEQFPLFLLASLWYALEELVKLESA